MPNPLRFAGYVAVFNALDRGGDMIRPGAFSESLKRTGGRVPLLWQHGGDAIGTVEMLAEDARGLRVIASLSSQSEAGAALSSGTVTGLSFGYRVRDAHGTRPRELRDVDLIEVSLVSHPMQPKARVIAVR